MRAIERHLPEDVGELPEVERCKAILTVLCSRRELLLQAVLGGAQNFRLQVQRLSRGLRVTDDMIAAMWGYVEFRKGANPVYEYEMLVMKREAEEEADRKEQATLRELYALSRGKNREEEEQKILKAMPAPEMARLPEIEQV